MRKKLDENYTWEIILAVLLCIASIANAGRYLIRAIESAKHRTYHAVFSALWTVTGAVCAFLGIVSFWESPLANGDEE